jgi:hypothetical protein
MRDPRLIVVLLQMSRAHARADTTLKDLQRRLKEELNCVEHAQIVRIRHYLTVPCLPRPWMYIWNFGMDENFLCVTSLCR